MSFRCEESIATVPLGFMCLPFWLQKAAQNWAVYSLRERSEAIRGVVGVRQRPPLPGYDTFVHATGQFNPMTYGSEDALRTPHVDDLASAVVTAGGVAPSVRSELANTTADCSSGGDDGEEEEENEATARTQAAAPLFPWERDGTHAFQVEPLPHPEFRTVLQESVFVVCAHGA